MTSVSRVRTPSKSSASNALRASCNRGSLPAEQSYKAFSQEPIIQAATVRYPVRRRSVRIEYASDALRAFLIRPVLT